MRIISKAIVGAFKNAREFFTYRTPTLEERRDTLRTFLKVGAVTTASLAVPKVADAAGALFQTPPPNPVQSFDLQRAEFGINVYATPNPDLPEHPTIISVTDFRTGHKYMVRKWDREGLIAYRSLDDGFQPTEVWFRADQQLSFQPSVTDPSTQRTYTSPFRDNDPKRKNPDIDFARQEVRAALMQMQLGCPKPEEGGGVNYSPVRMESFSRDYTVSRITGTDGHITRVDMYGPEMFVAFNIGDANSSAPVTIPFTMRDDRREPYPFDGLVDDLVQNLNGMTGIDRTRNNERFPLFRDFPKEVKENIAASILSVVLKDISMAYPRAPFGIKGKIPDPPPYSMAQIFGKGGFTMRGRAMPAAPQRGGLELPSWLQSPPPSYRLKL